MYTHPFVTQPAIPSVPPRFLTSGNWDVTLLCALDEEAGRMYVSLMASGGSLEVFLFVSRDS